MLEKGHITQHFHMSLFPNLTGSNDAYVLDGATARPQVSPLSVRKWKARSEMQRWRSLKGAKTKAANEPHAMHHRDHSLDLVRKQTLLRNVWNVQLGRRNMTHVATLDVLPGLSRCASSPHPVPSCRLSWCVDSNVTGYICVAQAFLTSVCSVCSPNHKLVWKLHLPSKV